MTEQSLIQACTQNNAAAQRELYNRFSGLLFSVCYRYAANREDAEDMLQETFVKVFTRINSFENKGNFEGWLKKIVINTCINYLKKNKKFTDNISLENAQNIDVKEESIASKLLGKQVIECLTMLPIGYRTIINLYSIEGFSHKEIATMLEIEESTSRSQYLRGKAILESILTKKKIINPTGEKLEWITLLNS
ncbi:MAG: RNA polymerase sigma factor [Chitinophagaceae bacterium]